jgi:Palmitoyl protein thioesterase
VLTNERDSCVPYHDVIIRVLNPEQQYGNVNEQVEQVAEQLNRIEELEGGFDAIGFSQGLYTLMSDSLL